MSTTFRETFAALLTGLGLGVRNIIPPTEGTSPANMIDTAVEGVSREPKRLVKRLDGELMSYSTTLSFARRCQHPHTLHFRLKVVEKISIPHGCGEYCGAHK